MEAITRKQTSFRLREDLLKVLQEEARKANRSLNNFVESTLMDAMYSVPNDETIAAMKKKRSDAVKTAHLFRAMPSDKAKEIRVEFTNRFGEVYVQTIRLKD